MTDNSYLELEFAEAKKKALSFIEKYNDKLPTEHCPSCNSVGHVPGLACPDPICAYVHPVSWVLLVDTEFGYDVISLNDRKHKVATFNVDEDAAENAVDADDTEGDGAS